MGDEMRTQYENIHVKHLILFLVKKWYWFGLTILAGIFVFALYGSVTLNHKDKQMAANNYQSTKKIEISAEEFEDIKTMAQYDDLLRAQEDYCTNSILMNMNPNQKYMRTDSFYISNSSEAEINTIMNAYLKKMDSSEFYNQLNVLLQENMNESYYREILTFETFPDLGMFRISISHFDSQKAVRVADAISDFVSSINNGVIQETVQHQLVVQKGEVWEVADSYVGTVQLKAIDALRATRDARNGKYLFLSDKQKEYLELYYEARYTEGYEEGQALEKSITINPSKYKVTFKNLKSYLKKGIIYPVIICLLVLTGMYIYSPVLLNPADVDEIYHLPLLGRIREKKGLDESCTIIGRKLKYFIQQQKEIENGLLFVFWDEKYKEEILTEGLKKNLNHDALQIYSVAGRLDQEENIQILNKTNSVILVEKIGKTSKEQLKSNINNCALFQKNIIGVILYE